MGGGGAAAGKQHASFRVPRIAGKYSEVKARYRTGEVVCAAEDAHAGRLQARRDAVEAALKKWLRRFEKAKYFNAETKRWARKAVKQVLAQLQIDLEKERAEGQQRRMAVLVPARTSNEMPWKVGAASAGRVG